MVDFAACIVDSVKPTVNLDSEECTTFMHFICDLINLLLGSVFFENNDVFLG